MSEYTEYRAKPPKSGSYAKEREKQLKKEREKQKKKEIKRIKKENNKKSILIQDQFDIIYNENKLISFVEKNKLDNLQKQLKTFLRQNDRVDDQERVREIGKEIQSLYKQIKKMKKKAEDDFMAYIHQQKMEMRQKCEQLIENLSERIKSLNAALNSQFIQQEIQDSEKEIHSMKKQLQQEQFDLVLQTGKELNTFLTHASELLDRKNAAYREILDSIMVMDDDLNDEVNRVWVGGELNELRQRAVTLQHSFEIGEKLQLIEAELVEIQKKREHLLKTARSRQEDDLSRKLMVQTIQKAMQNDNFTVSTPLLEGGQQGSVIVKGVKPGRVRQQQVEIRVELDGRIRMDVDGGDPEDEARIREFKVEKGKENKIACHQAAQEIKEFMAKAGLPLQEIHRNWHNPDKISKGAKDLPGGSQKDRNQRR